MIEPEALLVLPRLRVQNVNAASSALTWGFPAPSAFAGFVHALGRRLREEFPLQLEGVAVVCHHFEAKASEPSGKRTKVFHLTRNPVEKDGDTAPIVEEGRAHIEVSLVVGVSGEGLHLGTPLEAIAERAFEHSMAMRLAGGSILPPGNALRKRDLPELVFWPGTEEEASQLSRKIGRRLLPGFALVSREGLLEEHFRRLKADAPNVIRLDALLDLTRLNFEPPKRDGGGPAEGEGWRIRRRTGWLVPIASGYRSISPLYPAGTVRNTRDRVTPFRFVEGLHTVGEWLSPHRVSDVRQLMWVHQVDAGQGVYRCTTPYFARSIQEEGN